MTGAHFELWSEVGLSLRPSEVLPGCPFSSKMERT